MSSSRINEKPSLAKENLIEPPDINITDGTHDIITVEQKTDFKEIESPIGFGAYPTTSDNFPFAVSWQNPSKFLPEHIRYQAELVDRVLMKLNEEGKEVLGAKWFDGKVYPRYPNTFYYRSEITHKGEDVRVINGKRIVAPYTAGTSRIFGDGNAQLRLEILNAIEAETPLPAGVTVLEIDTHGIDPFEYLGIPRQ